MLDHMLQKLKIRYRHFNEKSYHTPRIHQTMLLQIITYFDLQHGLADHFETYEKIKRRFDEWIASKEHFFYRRIYLLKSGKML